MSGQGAKKPFGWADHSRVRKEEFAELLNSPFFHEVFNEKYVEGLERRREFLVSRSQKILGITFLIAVILGLAVLSVHPSFSLFGISMADARNFREVLLVISFSLGVYDALNNVRETTYIDEFIDTYIQRLSKGNDAAYRALHVRYGLGVDFMSNRKLGPIKPSVRQLIMIIVATVGWSLIGGVFLLLIPIVTMVDIIIHPTISTTISVLVDVYCVLGVVMTYGIHALSGTVVAEERKG